ncbi:DUF4834 family protein [Mucilaginibacter sp. UR6-11]|uniref:DUF4834 family protein n=1 Tax=Mucilaginibacter sp. UR6-11 TaxID=1435644 RepID=UPI001E46E41A|nr:DUF4834 family protein [Mucilaginibacter sp. UR6-11]MCC8425257.1 DUF4834 family protein [Mucilaginibacter sp. UR6-11]
MEGLIRFLFIAIGILYIVRAIMRWLIPMLFQSVVNKAQQQHQQQQTNYNSSQKQPTGRIKVDYVPEDRKKGKFPDSEGEFVDYEEVK